MKILIADKFSEKAIEALQKLGAEIIFQPELTADELPHNVKNTDILIVRSTKVTATTIDAGSSLSLIIRAGAGINTIDLEQASNKGVNVANCPGKNSDAVAELTIGLIIAADRKIVDQSADLRKSIWNKKKYGKASGLKGRTLGILGYGSIGKEVASRAKSFGMHVIVYSRHMTHEKAEKEHIGYCKTPLELARRSDIISVHLAASDQTKNLIDSTFLHTLRDETILVNTSRGEIVDQDALLVAIKNKNLKVALDVYQDEPTANDTQFPHIELASLITGTHHVGASTNQASEAIAQETVKIVKTFMETGRAPNQVNTQKKSLAPYNLIIIHYNRIGVLANILDALKKADINVEEMENIIFSGAQTAMCSLKLDDEPSPIFLKRITLEKNIIKTSLLKNIVVR